MSESHPDMAQEGQPQPTTAREPSREAVLVRHDFEPVDDMAVAGAAIPSPVVVVHYRHRRGLVLLLAALLFGSWAAVLASRTGLLGSDLLGRVRDIQANHSASRPAPVAVPEPPAPDTPLVLKVESLPSSSLPGVASPLSVFPELTLPSGTFNPDDRPVESPVPVADQTLPPPAAIAANPPPPPANEGAAIGFDMPGDAPPPAPVDPAVDTQVAMAEIAREASAKHEERDELKRARAEQAEIARQRAALVAEANRKQRAVAAGADAGQRDAFRTDLSLTIKQFGTRAAGPIRELVKRYNVEPSPEVEQAITRDLQAKGPIYNHDRGRRIALLRAHGLSEPAILSDLIVLELRDRTERGTTATAPIDLAIIRAARQLLAVPVSPLARASGTSLREPRPARTSRNGR